MDGELVKCGCSIGRPGFLVKRTVLSFRNVPFSCSGSSIFCGVRWRLHKRIGIAPMIFPEGPYKISAAMIFSAIYVFRCSFVAGSLQRVDDSTWPEIIDLPGLSRMVLQ